MQAMWTAGANGRPNHFLDCTAGGVSLDGRGGYNETRIVAFAGLNQTVQPCASRKAE